MPRINLLSGSTLHIPKDARFYRDFINERGICISVLDMCLDVDVPAKSIESVSYCETPWSPVESLSFQQFLDKIMPIRRPED